MREFITRYERKIRVAAAWVFVLAALAIPRVLAQVEACEDCGRGQTERKGSRIAKKEIRVLEQAIQNMASSFEAGTEGSPQEKAVAVSPKVFVSVCVRRGAVRVNGWARNEVRVFRKGGDELGIRVLERDGKEVPAWVEVLGYDPEAREKETDKCVSGELIELDVPEGASVTIKGLSSETSVEKVKSASIEIVGGDIYLSDVSERIEASTQQGGVTVKNSLGRMSVSTTTGNIVAYNTRPVEPGDYFRAKTRSGAVTLQSIGQREITASTISGSINYIGEIKNYGRYEFTTTNGLLNLVLPESSAFWVTAAYGGAFTSEFLMDTILENITEEAYFVKARVGTGEANLSLKSFSGTIRLRKKESLDPKKSVVVVP